jgi:F0F1-type ATP synthase delta subunit
MKKNIDTTELLNIVAEETTPGIFRKILSEIVEKYPEISEQILGELKLKQSFDTGHIEIVTANELSDRERKHIESGLNKKGSYQYSYTVNPKILGGIIIKNGENVTDNSLKSRLDKVFIEE